MKKSKQMHKLSSPPVSNITAQQYHNPFQILKNTAIHCRTTSCCHLLSLTRRAFYRFDDIFPLNARVHKKAAMLHTLSCIYHAASCLLQIHNPLRCPHSEIRLFVLQPCIPSNVCWFTLWLYAEKSATAESSK